MRIDISRKERRGGGLRTRSRRPRVELMESRMLLSAVTWTGDAGDDNWDTPDNWSTDSVPGSGDDVTIDTTATVVHSADVTDAINSLTTTGPLTISAGTLTIASAATIGGMLTLGDNTQALGGVTLSGTGTVNADGGITILEPTAYTSLEEVTLDGTTLNNAAGQTATWTYGTVTEENGAVFNNLGTFSIPYSNSGSTQFPNGGEWVQGAGAPASFNNSGTLIDSASEALDDRYGFAVAFDSTGGTVNVKNGSGTLSLVGGGTSTGGTFTAESDTELAFGATPGEAWMFDTSSSIGGAGTVAFEGGSNTTITINGTYDVSGVTEDGIAEIADPATVNFDGPVNSLGATLSVGGTVNFNTPLAGTADTIGTVSYGGMVNLGANDLNATTLTSFDGTLTGTGTITVGGLLTTENGTFSGSCTVNADGGMTGTYIVLDDGCTVNNPIGQTVSGNLDLLDLANGAVFNNYGTDTLSESELFQGSVNSGARPSFNNEGSFIVDADDPETVDTVGFSGLPFNNEGGTVEVQAGTLVLDGGGSSTTGSFTIDSGATLEVGVGSSDPSYTFGTGTTLSGAGSLNVSDYQSTAILAGTSTLTGPTTIGAGTLQVDGSQPSSAVDVNPNDNEGTTFFGTPTLSGTGTVGPITSADGTISPGDGATITGTLTANGNVTLDSRSTLNVALNGATAGTGYDQLNASGSVNLGGSTLTGSLGFTPISGETFTIIKSTAPIVGTFQGLPQGASVTIGGVPFTVNYAADGGDAVVLTPSVTPTLAATTTAVTSSANPSALGHNVTFTAVVASTASGNPTGAVTFTIDGQAEPPVNLAVVNGVDQATFTTSSLVLGPNAIGAAYGGDTAFASSSATPLTGTVNAPPLLATATQVTSSSASSTVGQTVTFTADVTGSGTAAPTGSVVFTIDGQAEPPVPLSVVNGVARATLSVSTLAAGRHTVVASYGGDADDSPSRSSGQIQVVSATSTATTPTTGSGTTTSGPVDTDGPRIASMKRFGYHMMPTRIVLTFDQALDAVTAEDVKDYRIIGPAGRTIAIRKAVYDPAALTVTLLPVERISIHHPYKLIVNGTAPRGLTNTKGQLLDGANRGSADSNYRAPLTWRNLVLDPTRPKVSHPTQT